jgi:hypothetical protein
MLSGNIQLSNRVNFTIKQYRKNTILPDLSIVFTRLSKISSGDKIER